MARTSKQRAFLAKVRTGDASPKKTVNPKLEKMVENLLDEAGKPGSVLTFDQKMAVGKLALQMEAVRNKLTDDDYGAGFGDEDETTQGDRNDRSGSGE